MEELKQSCKENKYPAVEYNKDAKEVNYVNLHTVIKVARTEDLIEQIGKDIFFDLVDHDKVYSFRVHTYTPFSLFKEEIAKKFGVPVPLQRYWSWVKRDNHTYRPHRPLTQQEETLFMRKLAKSSGVEGLKLFLEIQPALNMHPSPPAPDRSKEDILLFFKLYDPAKEELRFLGRLFVKGSGKFIEILKKLNQMARFAPDEDIELYEEITYEPKVICEHIEKSLTFQAKQLKNGDIICVQKSLTIENKEQCRYPDVPSFLESVQVLGDDAQGLN